MFRLSTSETDHEYNDLRVNIVVIETGRYAILDREDGKGFIQLETIDNIFISHSAQSYILESDEITYYLNRE